MDSLGVLQELFTAWLMACTLIVTLLEIYWVFMVVIPLMKGGE